LAGGSESCALVRSPESTGARQKKRAKGLRGLKKKEKDGHRELRCVIPALCAASVTRKKAVDDKLASISKKKRAAFSELLQQRTRKKGGALS